MTPAGLFEIARHPRAELRDLEAEKPIEVMRDRTATTPIAWLRQRPDIERATRDRSTEDACGLSDGAPQARQVLHL